MVSYDSTEFIKHSKIEVKYSKNIYLGRIFEIQYDCKCPKILKKKKEKKDLKYWSPYPNQLLLITYDDV